jgi:transcriptional regulator of acetoin/glycerol metabolism
MAKSVAPAHQRELARLGHQLDEALSRVELIRSRLDERLFAWHVEGVSIAALAREAGVSRETVYKSIERHRAQLGA